MRLHLAGICSADGIKDELGDILYGLESFAYWKPWEGAYIKKWKGFLLDSGAFTFIMSGKVGADFESYVDKYIEFVKAYQIERFFEMDTDSVHGYDKVRQIRHRIENAVGRQTIPVWHITRGMDDFRAMCKDYKYVAIGTMVNKNGKKLRIKHIEKQLIDMAHEQGCQIHGLGRTSDTDFRMGYDSVDSTSWLSATRWGSVPQFMNGRIVNVNHPNKRMCRGRIDALHHSIQAWKKMQQYADKYL